MSIYIGPVRGATTASGYDYFGITPNYGPQASGTALYPSSDDIYAWAHNTTSSRIAALEADIAELRAALAAALPLMQERLREVCDARVSEPGIAAQRALDALHDGRVQAGPPPRYVGYPDDDDCE